MAKVTLLADGGEMTVSRPLASHVWGAWDVTVPEGSTQQATDDRIAKGYASKIPDAGTGLFDRAFIRADVKIDIPKNQTNVEESIDTAAKKVDGNTFFERDITEAGLCGFTPNKDFKVGDLVNVVIWGKKVELLVTSIEMVTRNGNKTGWLVHVGGQMVKDLKRLGQKSREVDAKILEERRQRLKDSASIRGEVKTASAAATAAASSAVQAKSQAEAAKQESQAAKVTAERAEKIAGDATVVGSENLAKIERLTGEVAEQAPKITEAQAELLKHSGELSKLNASLATAKQDVTRVDSALAQAREKLDSQGSKIQSVENAISQNHASVQARLGELSGTVSQNSAKANEAIGEARDLLKKLDSTTVSSGNIIPNHLGTNVPVWAPKDAVRKSSTRGDLWRIKGSYSPDASRKFSVNPDVQYLLTVIFSTSTGEANVSLKLLREESPNLSSILTVKEIDKTGEVVDTRIGSNYLLDNFSIPRNAYLPAEKNFIVTFYESVSVVHFSDLVFSGYSAEMQIRLEPLNSSEVYHRKLQKLATEANTNAIEANAKSIDALNLAQSEQRKLLKLQQDFNAGQVRWNQAQQLVNAKQAEWNRAAQQASEVQAVINAKQAEWNLAAERAQDAQRILNAKQAEWNRATATAVEANQKASQAARDIATANQRTTQALQEAQAADRKITTETARLTELILDRSVAIMSAKSDVRTRAHDLKVAIMMPGINRILNVFAHPDFDSKLSLMVFYPRSGAVYHYNIEGYRADTNFQTMNLTDLSSDYQRFLNPISSGGKIKRATIYVPTGNVGSCLAFVESLTSTV